jgi:hypothetical protein
VREGKSARREGHRCSFGQWAAWGIFRIGLMPIMATACPPLGCLMALFHQVKSHVKLN